jgi:predicted PurR-regulated permease PerM
MHIEQQKMRPHFLVLCMVGAAVLAAAVLWPFLKPLALAIIFAVVLEGLYLRISHALGGWPSLSALITVIASVVVILLPLSLIGVLVGNEAHGLYVSLEQGSGRSAVSDLFLKVGDAVAPASPLLGDFVRGISTDLDRYVKEALQWITEHAGEIFSGASRLLLSSFIFFIALYYLLRDGKKVRKILIDLSPLNDRDDKGVFNRLELTINSIIKGNFVIALIQGLLTTTGFLIFGIPNALLWGMLAAVAALIPGVGTALVLAPAIAFLFLTGTSFQAFGLLIWAVLAVGLVDNLLGPKLVGKGAKLHPLLVLLSVLGGLALFGPIGIFLGPLSVSFLFALLSIYADFSKLS